MAGACAGGGESGASDREPSTTDAVASTTTTATASDPVPSPGCTTGTEVPSVRERREIDVEGQNRWYLLTAPEAATGDTPVPLVLDFHGLSEGAEFHSQSTGWSELAASEGFVAAFPNGTGQPVAWNLTSSGPNPDLDFVDALVTRLGDELCIDTSRIYSTGLSNGALLSSVLACTRSETFAAVAPVAGLTHPEDCDPAEPVPVLTFHGTGDPILRFGGGVDGELLGDLLAGKDVTTTSAPPPDLEGPGYPEAARAWAETNGCGGPTDERVGTEIIHRTWDCSDGAAVEFYVIEGGGHTWPGSAALTAEGIARIVGPTTQEIDATQVSWQFFQRFTRG